MTKANVLDAIDQAVTAHVSMSQPRTWFERLPTEAQETLTAARDKFLAGGYTVTRTVLARVLISHAEKRGWKLGYLKRLTSWLGTQD